MISTITEDTDDKSTTVVLRKTTSTTTTDITFNKLSTDHGEIELFKVDPRTRRSFIDKTAYAKLNRSFNSGSNRRSVGNLKEKFENKSSSVDLKIEEIKPTKGENLEQKEKTSEIIADVVEKRVEESKPKEEKPIIHSPVKSKPVPLPKPRHLIKKKPKDENSNLVEKSPTTPDEEDSVPELEERTVIIRQTTASQDSIDKIAKELSYFTMDSKRERKRMNSFRKLLSGTFFSKDKSKKEEEKNRQKQENLQNRRENLIYKDNFQNETNYNKQTPTLSNGHHTSSIKQQPPPQPPELTPEERKRIEQQFAQKHINKFEQARQNFLEPKNDYIPMDRPLRKPTIADYISAPVQKYIDTSSTTSSEQESRTTLNRKPNEIQRDTPPRAQETYQNLKPIVNPKTSTYKMEKSQESLPRTIERNLDKSDNKQYPDKNPKPELDETYGTVFDSLEYVAARNSDSSKSMNSPKSPSFEVSKLRLPPNREIYDLQPRVRSPIPQNRISTDKIIATELLRNSRSPTPQKKIEEVKSKPPMPPARIYERKLSDKTAPGREQIVTNAMVHTPRSQTPTQVELRNSISSINGRSPTPLDLRMAASLKLSPQKPDIRRSVEEYYWKELKKMKEQEDYMYIMQINNAEDARVRRSRSLSPSSQRYGRRSLSLPRDVRPPIPIPVDYPENIYGRAPPPQPIPEERTLILNPRQSYQQPPPQFIRNNPERRTISHMSNDSLQRPIFRRGSLNKPEVYDNQTYNKKVSFISNETDQAWPTKNGYTQSPPQRRVIDKRESLDDDVFLPESPQYIQRIYGNQKMINEAIYNQKMVNDAIYKQKLSNGMMYGSQNIPNEPIYGGRPNYRQQTEEQIYGLQGRAPQHLGTRQLSMDSLPRQDIYIRNQQRPLVRREVILQDDIYGQHGGYQPQQQYLSNGQLSAQRSIYSSRQSIQEPIYGQNHKQVTVTNKYCDMYGQIHDQMSRGVVMGRLQQSPRTPPSQQNFIRGTRLTASANDMGRRYYSNEPIYNPNLNYDHRPLPPIPNKNKKVPAVVPSDTESAGSDASEVRRIMQKQTKNNSKKRGLLGK